MIFDFLSDYAGFLPAKLKASTGLIPNPGRGWYQIYYFYLPQQPDFQELRWCLRENETVALAVVNIGFYRDKALDSHALEVIAGILDFFQQYKKDLILRFVYDSEGNGLLHEPARFSQVEEHIQQLAPTIRSYTNTIFVLQGMFVGNWGEMHGSKYLSSVHLKRLNTLLESAAGENTWLAVRRPCQWRLLHGPEDRDLRMGLYDDGIFGSDTNLGTFGYLKRRETQWENPWCPEDELSFESRLCAAVPHGGEAIASQQMPAPSKADVLQRLRQMHISYLNGVYDPRILDAWKQSASPWPGVSLYDYVGAHLGYRFCVKRVRVQRKNHRNWLKITLENTGFAPCYEDYTVTLEIVTANNVTQQETDWDLRTVMAGSAVHWECVLPEEDGDLYLLARRKKDGRILRFAHDEQPQGKLLLGCLSSRKDRR